MTVVTFIKLIIDFIRHYKIAHEYKYFTYA